MARVDNKDIIRVINGIEVDNFLRVSNYSNESKNALKDFVETYGLDDANVHDFIRDIKKVDNYEEVEGVNNYSIVLTLGAVWICFICRAFDFCNDYLVYSSILFVFTFILSILCYKHYKFIKKCKYNSIIKLRDIYNIRQLLESN